MPIKLISTLPKLAPDPRCCTMSSIGITVGGIALSAGVAAATAPGQIQYPDTAASSAALQDANAAELPVWLQEEAAAQEGGQTTIPTASTTQTETTPTLYVNAPDASPGTKVPYVATDWQPGGKYYVAGQAPPIITSVPENSQVTTQGGTETLNFQGYGTADIEAAQATQAADAQLALAQKFDPQFIARSLADEQLANPQGAAARTEENNLIQQEVAHPLTNPVADQLNQQVSQQISAAANSEMTPAEQAQFNASVQSATGARGGGGSAAAMEQPIVTGASGLQRQQAAAQEGTGWLASGQTPADFTYRQQQQAMADLSSMVNGSTPESQFKQLSGAQIGPTPAGPAATMSQLPNQGNAAQQAAIQSTNTQMSNALQQANPWSVGLGSAMQLGTAFAKAS